MGYRTLGVMALGITALATATLLAQTTREAEMRQWVSQNLDRIRAAAAQYERDNPQTAPAATASRPATQPAAVVVDPAKRAVLALIIHELSDGNFKTREEAQKKLAALGNEYKPAVETMLAETRDEETRARLEKMLDMIAMREALNPPPISLSLNHSNIDDITRALTKALGRPVSATAGLTDVTLNLERKNFWEVISAINAQAPLDVETRGGERTVYLLNSLAQGAYIRASIQGAFAFVPMGINLVRKITPGAPDKVENNFGFVMRCGVDPRVRIVMMPPPVFSEIADDAGNDLRGPVGPYSGRTSSLDVYVKLKYPDKPGKRIASIKGSIKLRVVSEMKTLEVPDFSNVLDKPLELDGYKITFSRLFVNRHLSMVYSSQSPEPDNTLVGSIGPSAEFDIIDSTGKHICQLDIHGNENAVSSESEFVLPLKARFSVPARISEVTVPFEFKDLPMP